jgi:RNA-binding proteins (RRM domain)
MDKVTDCRILKDKDTGVSRGMAYVDFETVEDAKAALAQDGLEIDGRKLVIALSNPPKKG